MRSIFLTAFQPPTRLWQVTYRNPIQQELASPHFRGENTGAQRGWINYSRTKAGTEIEFRPVPRVLGSLPTLPRRPNHHLHPFKVVIPSEWHHPCHQPSVAFRFKLIAMRCILKSSPSVALTVCPCGRQLSHRGGQTGNLSSVRDSSPCLRADTLQGRRS